MATTTTNYGFDVPTSSDLVKNGATQIALLGQDLDTFLFRPFSRNGALNSSFNVWQSGTSTTWVSNNSQYYPADRWQAFSATTDRTFTRQTTSDTTNLPNIQYCGRFQRTSGNSNTSAMALQQNWESVNSVPYAGKTVTYSFYARKGANFSGASSLLDAKVLSGTGTDQNIIFPGYTGNVAVISQSATLTTTWQRFQYTGIVPTNSNELCLQFGYTPVGTAGAADYFEVTGVQLEVGNQASPYAPATPTYATELAACKYYFRRYGGNHTFEAFGVAQADSITAANLVFQFETGMRTSPIGSYGSAANFAACNAAGAGLTVTSISSNVLTKTSAGLILAVSAGLVAGNASFIRANNSLSATIDFSAEL